MFSARNKNCSFHLLRSLSACVTRGLGLGVLKCVAIDVRSINVRSIRIRILASTHASCERRAKEKRRGFSAFQFSYMRTNVNMLCECVKLMHGRYSTKCVTWDFLRWFLFTQFQCRNNCCQLQLHHTDLSEVWSILLTRYRFESIGPSFPCVGKSRQSVIKPYYAHDLGLHFTNIRPRSSQWFLMVAVNVSDL